jgi:hypothetical protein
VIVKPLEKGSAIVMQSLPPHNLSKRFRHNGLRPGITGREPAPVLADSATEDEAPSATAAAPRSGGAAWPSLAAQAFHGLAGEVVRAIEPHSEADPAAILLQFLAAFGNVVGPGPHCMVESTSHSLNLFVVLVGESSKARKGTSWGHIRRLFAGVDAEWLDQRVTGGLCSAEGLISEVRDEEFVTDRRLFAVSDEFASVLRIMGREGNTLSPILRSAWDSGNLRTLVKHDPLRATGAHISLLGHITRLELLRYLSDTESHNGFAPVELHPAEQVPARRRIPPRKHFGRARF